MNVLNWILLLALGIALCGWGYSELGRRSWKTAANQWRKAADSWKAVAVRGRMQHPRYGVPSVPKAKPGVNHD